jgi:hypothetical protein
MADLQKSAAAIKAAERATMHLRKVRRTPPRTPPRTTLHAATHATMLHSA